MRLIRGLSVLLVIVLGLAGCQLEYPIDMKFKWSMKQGEMKWADNSGPIKARKINVTAKTSPSGNNIAVAAVLVEDLDATKDQLKKGGEPPKYLAFHAGADKVDLDFVIAAKTPFVVVVRNLADEVTEVDLKIKSK
jgi:hypothetical protein